MLKTRIGVLVSGGGTNLQALIDAEKNGIINNGTIAAVISNNPDAYALKRAEQNNIPAFAIAKGSYASQQEFEALLDKLLKENNIDIIVLAGFMKILSKDFVTLYPERIINIHPALIPSFCGEGFYGLHVHEAALSYGVKVTGATVHFVNEIPDGGRIIMQKAVNVEDNDTPESLQKRVMEQAEWSILPLATEQIAKEWREKHVN